MTSTSNSSFVAAVGRCLTTGDYADFTIRCENHDIVSLYARNHSGFMLCAKAVS
ncbi:hypothetical protein VE03_10444, partial [Pseudogymnoascus sp. 23342-1-I1]